MGKVKAPVFFIPSPSATKEALNLESYDEFYKEYDTPEKRTLYNNYQTDEQFKAMGVASPYKVLDKGVAIFDENAKLLTDEEIGMLRPEQQAFAKMHNELVEGYGRVRTPGFLRRTFANSMTGGWVDMLGGDTDLFKGFQIKQDGVYLDGTKLSLSPEEFATLSDFSRKVSGSDIEKSFLDKAAETTVSLLWDMPLMALGNAVVGGAMKATSVGSALLRTTQPFQRALGQVAMQAGNFNLLGLPATVKATRDEGVSGAFDSIWHNAKLGTIGAATGSLGYGLGRAGALGKLFPGNPALQEEVGAIAGSALFGYGTSKIEGASNEEALASALSFAAMHFTNPTAFERVMREGFIKGNAKANNVFVDVPNDKIHPYGDQPGYYIKEDNKYFPINKNAFKNEGRVERMEGYEPILSTEENAGLFKEYWKVNDHYNEGYMQALRDERISRNADKIYKSWKAEKNIPEGTDDVELHILAEQTAYAMAVDKTTKTFQRWKFIDSPEVHNQALKMSDEFKIPYAMVKENIVREVKKYLENPDSYIYTEKTKEGSKFADKIEPLDEQLFKGRDLFIKELSKNNKTTLGAKEAIFVSPDHQTQTVKINEDGSVTNVSTGFTFNPPADRLALRVADAQGIIARDKENVNKPQEEPKPATEEKPTEEVPVKEEIPYYENPANISKLADKIQNGGEFTPEDNQLYKNFPKEVEEELNRRYTGNDVPDEPVTPGQALLKKLEIQDKAYRDEQIAILKGAEPIPDNALVDAQGQPIESSESKKASAGLRENEKEVMGIKPKPILAGKSADKYSLDTLHELNQITHPELPKDEDLIPKEEKPNGESLQGNKEEIKPSVVDEVLKEDKIQKQTQNLLDRGSEFIDDKNTTEEDLAGIVREADLLLKDLIPDEELRNMTRLFTTGRDTLPEQVQELLSLRDKADTKKHDMRLQREATEGKKDETSNVATPDNRRRVLTIERKKTPHDKSTTEGMEYGDWVQAMYKRSESNQDFLKKIGAPKELSFLGRWLDNLNTNVRFQQTMADGKGGQYRGVGYATGEAKHTITFSKAESTDKAEFIRMYAHEAIHNVLQNPLNLDLWTNKIMPEFKRVADIIKTELKNDRAVLKSLGRKIDPDTAYQLDYMLSVMDGKDLKLGFTELATQALTDPYIARYLEMIPVERKGSRVHNTAWSKIKEWIKSLGAKIDGGEPVIGVPNSALDEITNTISRANTEFSKKPGLGRQNSKPRNDNKPPSDLEGEGGIDISFDSRKRDDKRASEIDSNLSEERKKILDTKYSPEYKRAIELKYDDNLGKKREIAERIFTEPNKTDELDESVSTKKSSYVTKPYHEISTEGQIVDLGQVEKAGVMDKDYWKKQGNFIQDKLLKAKLALMKYNDLNIPPVYKAELSPKFRNYAYYWGESAIREMHFHTNNLLNDIHYWNQGAELHKLAGISGAENVLKSMKGQLPVSPKALEFMKAIADYSHGRYTGQIGEEIPFSEFAKWAGFDKDQTSLLNTYRKVMQGAIELRKEYLKRILIDFDDDIVKYMEGKTIKRLMTQSGYKLEDKSNFNEVINKDPKIKEFFADYIINEKYGNWGKNFYYNEVRPATLGTHIVEAQKPRMKDGQPVLDKDGQPVYDRVSTYFDNVNDTAVGVKKLQDAGYRVTQNFEINNEFIKKGEHLTKLNQHQLLELAIAGNVPLDNDVVQKLLDATKRGIDLHTIQKEYIPGMKYNIKEFEHQLSRFINESVNGSIKSYYYSAIDRKLIDWESRLTNAYKSSHQTEDIIKEQSELDYARRYFNQLKTAEKSWIDSLRGYTIAWQVGGIKPSFLFQQATQILQTTMPQVIQHIKDNGGTTGDALKLFSKVTTDAVTANLALRAYKEGKSIAGMGVAPEVVDMLRKLEHMDKITPTGLSELTADANSIEFQYADGRGKQLMVFKKLMTAMGKGVEKWTRTHSALAFYEIGKGHGLKGNELLDFVASGIDKTMSEWGKGGRAPILDSDKLSPTQNSFAHAIKKSIMTYKTFSFNNYGMWNDMIRNKHYAALASKMMISTGMAGITKFPLMAGMFYVAQMFTDDDIDYEMWKLADKLDKQVPQAGGILHRGLLSTIGLDMRQTFGEDTPLISDLWAESWSKSWEGKVLDITLGAPLGFSKDMVASLDEFKRDAWNQITDQSAMMTEDEMKRAERIKEKLFPIFIRNYLQGARMDKDGIEVQGKKIVMRNDLSAYDVALKMLSFPIQKQTRAFSEAQEGVETQYNKYKKIIEVGSKHRKDMESMGIPQEQINEEMKRVTKQMNEAREKIKELEPQVRELKLRRKLNQ